MRAFLLLAVAPTLAFAGPPPTTDANETRESEMLYEIVPLHASQLGWRYGADVLAAALATSDGKSGQAGGALTASAQVGLGATPDCDLVALGGQLATRSDDRVVSAQQWASLCPLGGNGNLTIDHRLEWDVTPRLLALPHLRPGTQRRETVGLSMFGSEVPLDPKHPNGVDFQQGGTLRLETQVGWTPESKTDDIQISMIAVLRNFRHDYGDGGSALELGFIGAGLEAMLVAGDPSAASVASLSGELAHVEGIRIGGIRLGGRLGGRVVPEGRGDKATYQQRLWVIGEGGISSERDLARNVTMRLAGDRRGMPTWDGRFLVDDRATWSLFGHRGRLSGRLDLAAANEHLLAIGEHHDIATGGVTAASELGLSSSFALKLQSDVGRSVYAPGANLDAPRWASETLLMLALHAKT